jgi:Flp pilus assembly pilin Flp
VYGADKETVMDREFQPRRLQDGATLVEYVLLVSFIAIAVIITVAVVGTMLDEQYSRFVACIQTPESCE